MNEALQSLCENFIWNRDQIKACFGWENSYVYPVCAQVYIDRRRHADAEALKAARALLRARTGAFSSFRGSVRAVTICQLALEAQPELMLERALEVYRLLRERFFPSDYLPVAAMSLARLAEPEQYAYLATRTRRVYDLMKARHPFLTSGEDNAFAALLALTPRDDAALIDEAEACYALLHRDFPSGNAVQSLSHVLTLGEGAAVDKCARSAALYEALKARGKKYGRHYELASLGVLALLPQPLDALADEVAEADDFLAGQKGYGFWGLGRRQRLMHAAMLVASAHASGDAADAAKHTVAVTSAIAMIVAQQTAIISAVAAGSAASSAAH